VHRAYMSYLMECELNLHTRHMVYLRE
jgi:hypothetical protein